VPRTNQRSQYNVHKFIIVFYTLESLDVGLDDDVLRYVQDLCSLLNDHNNSNNGTCQLADGNNIHMLRPNASAPATMPCSLPPATVESSSQREKRSFYFIVQNK